MLNSFTYKGYTLVEDEEIEPMENRKIFHMVTPPGGKEFMMKMTPYENLTEESFQRWIDMGCPDHPYANWNNKSLEELWNYRQKILSENK